MRIPNVRLAAIGTVAALAVIGSLMNSPHSIVKGAGGGPTVTIDSTQLPLHVTTNDATAILYDDTFLTTNGGGSIGPLDVSHMKSVRVSAEFFGGFCAPNPCPNTRVVVYGGDREIDSFTVVPGGEGDPGSFASRVYNVPGPSLRLQFYSTATINLHVGVFARND
jgi:hypothetical protein